MEVINYSPLAVYTITIEVWTVSHASECAQDACKRPTQTKAMFIGWTIARVLGAYARATGPRAGRRQDSEHHSRQPRQSRASATSGRKMTSSG